MCQRLVDVDASDAQNESSAARAQSVNGVVADVADDLMKLRRIPEGGAGAIGPVGDDLDVVGNDRAQQGENFVRQCGQVYRRAQTPLNRAEVEHLLRDTFGAVGR